MNEDLVFGYLLLNGFEISFSHLDEVYFSKKENISPTRNYGISHMFKSYFDDSILNYRYAGTYFYYNTIGNKKPKINELIKCVYDIKEDQRQSDFGSNETFKEYNNCIYLSNKFRIEGYTVINNVLYIKPLEAWAKELLNSREIASYLGRSSIPYLKFLIDPKDIICW